MTHKIQSIVTDNVTVGQNFFFFFLSSNKYDSVLMTQAILTEEGWEKAVESRGKAKLKTVVYFVPIYRCKAKHEKKHFLTYSY